MTEQLTGLLARAGSTRRCGLVACRAIGSVGTSASPAPCWTTGSLSSLGSRVLAGQQERPWQVAERWQFRPGRGDPPEP